MSLQTVRKADVRYFNVNFYGHEACEVWEMTKMPCLPKYSFTLAGFVEWNLQESFVLYKLLLLLLLLHIYLLTYVITY